MSKWKISQGEYLKRLHLSQEQFVKFLRLPQLEDVQTIVPLRDLTVVDSLLPMSASVLDYLLNILTTLDGRRPFYQSAFRILSIDPRQLKVGQKFVYRETYQQLLENVPAIFRNFLAANGEGLGNLGPYFAFGLTASNEYAMACYLPPIVEKHELDLVIVDGMHRNFIARQAGTTINTVLVNRVNLPFPCQTHEWSEVKVIALAEKPKELKDRYFDLHQELFRDLKYLGIDG